MLKSACTILWFLAAALVARSQNYRLTGTVSDEHGKPVPFASIYKKDATVGTAANGEGTFRLMLPGGQQELLVRAIGYKQATQRIVLNKDTAISITLHTESYLLDEVVIGTGEDPAYAIIRKAIAQRQKYLNQAEPYTAKVYIKGVQRLLQAPKKFLGLDLDQVAREIGLDSNRTGIVYLSESESRITVRPPDGFREEMVSSSFSGNNRAFSFNRAADLKLNFYENLQPIFDGLSARPFISPIADNALAHYRYRLLGSSEEQGLTIHKIHVEPRRKADPLYAGDIYIVDDSWRIYGVNLRLTKAAGINLLDTLDIRQDMLPLAHGQWQPAGIQLDFTGGLLGFRIGGYFAAVYSEYAFQPQLPPRLFRETLRIEAGVNERDSVYWETYRPLPLTDEERLDYVRKDSLQRRRESKAYLDSLDRVTNRVKPLGLLTTGYTHRNRAQRSSLTVDGLATSLLFNSVEGLALNYGARYTKQLDSARNRNLSVYGNARYGFANQRFNGYLGTRLPVGEGTLELYGGSDMQDLNNRGSLPPLFNTIGTTFFGRNFQKLYERTFVSATWQQALPGNIKATASASWENRLWLPNATDYTFWDRNKRHLTSNNPLMPGADAPLFDEHQAFLISLGLSYDFGTTYETYPHKRVYRPSRWPTLSINYTKGVAEAFGSDVDYDLLSARLHKTGIGLGLYGHLSFDARAGAFLNRKRLYFTDYSHFNGTQTLISDQQLSTFLLLDYYRHSTTGRFAELHAEYNLATALTSKVPLLRRLKLEEIIGVHYLNTRETTHYGEIHAGLRWRRLSVMYARSVGTDSALRDREALRIGVRLF